MTKNIVDCANMLRNGVSLLMANETRKAVKKATKAVTVFLFFCMPLISFSQLHQYLFNPTLAEIGGGPALTERLTCGALAGGVSQQSEVRNGTCVNFNAWCYSTGAGFRYSNPGLITDSYTINMYCKFQGQGYLRILDFRGGTDDRGLYLYNGCLVYYNVNVIGPCPSLLLNTYYLLTVVRDGTTNTISIYINGVLFGTIGDPAGIIRPTTNTSPIDFFTDNNCESPYGCIRYASVTPSIATAGQIATLYASLPTLTGEVVSPGPSVSVTPPIATLNCITPNTTLTVNGTGTYVWSGGQTTATNLVSAANTYTVTLTDVNGCTASASSTVTLDNTPPTAGISPSSGILNCSTPSVNLTATGGGTYNWGGGIITASRSVSSPATYTVTVTGANGCTATASSIITQNITPPTATVTPTTGTISCSSPTVLLTAGGGASYNWGGGITTTTNTVISSGTYTVTAIAANGCTATASAVVSQNTTPPLASVSPTNISLTCTVNSAVITASGGGTYDWGGGITTTANTVNSSGTYTVTVTAPNGCTATASSVVSQNITPPIASVSPSTASLTCSQPTATLTASGGGTYNWGGGVTTVTNTVNAANTYTVTVTGANGCTATANAIVSQSTAIPAAAINPSSAVLTCATPNVTLTASGGATYNWGGGITTASNTISAPGNYTVTVTGINGCTATATVSVSQNNTPPTASINPASAVITCAAPNITLTAAGGGTYNWGGGITSATNTVNGPNTYTVTVTSANGCSATASSVITQNTAPPALSISPSSAVLTCSVPSISLTANGAGTYNWGGGITTATNLVSAANTYSVTLTDINGCTASASSTVSSNTAPPIAIVSPTNSTLTCVTLTVPVTASGGTSYDWGGGVTTATNTVSSANTYTVTVTGSNGCTATASSVINQDITTPVAAVSPTSGTLTCTTNSINLTASGGNSYDWGAGITTANNTITQPNSYTVTVTGTNGCTATATSVIIQDITPPVANITPANATLTCASPTATLTAGGGTSYNWGGGITTSTNTVSAPNNYSVTVTAANGCTAAATAIITQSVTTPLAAVTPPNAAIDCNNSTAVLTASGGVSYNWGGGINSAANTVGNAGTYVVTVTDVNGCTATASSTVSQDFTPPTALVTTTSASLTCVTLTATLTASGGVSYDWGGGVTTATNTVSSANTYTVTVTGSNGCTATASSVINQDITTPVAAVSPTSGTLTCTTNSINLTASGGNSYDWGAGITTANNTITQPNSYTVTVTGTNGCTATATSVIIQDITPPVANITPANATLTCASPTATLTAGGGTSYNWGGGITTSTNTVSAPNTYSVTVTAANGCTASNSAIISQNITTPNVSITPAGGLTCALLNTTLTASSTTPNATFNWGAGNISTTKTVTSGGNYSVTATDPVNGCTATASIAVSQNTNAPNISVSVSGILSCVNTNVTITAASTTANATYNWGGGNTTITNTVGNPGNYSVTATDPANSCTALATQAVTQNIAPPNVSIATPQELNCINSSVTLSATSTVPGVAYNWGGGINTPSNTVSSAASYSVTATDPINGCTATASSTVNQNIIIPSAAIAPPAVITCHSPSVTLLSSTNAINPAYNWGSNNTGSGYTVSTTGTYTVTITDQANGCSASASTTVTDIPLMSLTQSHTNVSCFGFADGGIDLTVSGGQAPFAYTWSNTAITEDLTAIPAATYSVVVTDAINCTANLSLLITEPASMLVTETHTDVTCNGANNGTININTSAGTPVYTYRWNDNNVNEDRSNLAPGNYSVTVTDNNACSVSATSSINEPAAIDIQPTIIQPTCASNGNDGAIRITTNGGTAPFSFSWSNGINTTTNSNLGEGSFTITVTDANACALSATYQLSYIYNFTVDASPFSTIKLGQSANINYTLTGNTGNYTALWSPELTLSCSNCAAPVATPVYSTLYNITITNDVGCYASDTVGVQVLPLYETFVPNVFTPNGDGVNDAFEMFGNLNGIEYIEMQIFDRKGEKVFESNDHHFIWDGTFKGVALEPQVLVWKMKLTWLNEHKEELRKGTLTLVK
jgi:gliding motility-associated-like protein